MITPITDPRYPPQPQVCSHHQIEMEWDDELEMEVCPECDAENRQAEEMADASERRFFDMADPAYQYDVRGFGDYDPPEPPDFY